MDRTRKRCYFPLEFFMEKNWYNIEDSWKFPKENAEFYEKNKDEFGLLFEDEDVFPEHVEDNDNCTAFEKAYLSYIFPDGKILMPSTGGDYVLIFV